jgi:hypothetical protein
MMVSKEERPRTFYNKDNDTYYMHYKDISDRQVSWEEFTSDQVAVSKQELEDILQHYNYFQ